MFLFSPLLHIHSDQILSTYTRIITHNQTKLRLCCHIWMLIMQLGQSGPRFSNQTKIGHGWLFLINDGKFTVTKEATTAVNVDITDRF